MYKEQWISGVYNLAYRTCAKGGDLDKWIPPNTSRHADGQICMKDKWFSIRKQLLV